MPAVPPSETSLKKVQKFVEHYWAKSGTFAHPDKGVVEVVINGLAQHLDELGKPLCPCNFYPDKKAEAENRTWICGCKEMKEYKYCHCLLFVNQDGLPITEYLPEHHEGRLTYGFITDPTPNKGRESTKVTHPRH